MAEGMLTPRDLLDLAETGGSATADPVDKTYEGDNRPAYIKNKTNITADEYNQFLSELDDITAQANLDFRQEQLRQRIIDEAQGRQYDPNSNRNLEAQARQGALFEQQSQALLDKYGVPRTFTTDAGSVYRFNPNGKYNKVFDAGMDFGDYLKAAVKVAITTVATAGIGSAVAAGLGAAGVPANVANTIADIAVGLGRSGGDLKQGIISAFAPNSEELRQVTDYFPDGIDGLINVARTVYDTASAETQPDVTTDFEVNIDPKQTDPITVDEDTGDVTIGLPEAPQPTVETPTETVTDTTQSGGGQEVVTEGDLTGDPDVIFSDTVGQPTTPAEEGTFDPEHPWIYQGDGVFVHSRTGETVTQDVGDAPYVVGETYGGPADEPQGPADSGTEEPLPVPSIFGGEGSPPPSQGLGDGQGEGTGDGEGDGEGDGKGTGLFGGIGAGSTVTAQPYMGSISFNPQLLTPIMPKQSRDYLAELLARLQQ